MTESANAESSEASGPDIVGMVMIGVPLGYVADPETREKRGMLRYAREFVLVDPDAYEVLFRATGPVRRSTLTNYASGRGVEEPESVVERCLQEGLLREINFRSDVDHDWTDVRLHTIGMGMGPDAEGRWRISVPGRNDPAQVHTVLLEEQFDYLLWAGSDGRSLEEVVTAVAEDLRLPRGPVRKIVPGAAFKLLRERAAHLDHVP